MKFTQNTIFAIDIFNTSGIARFTTYRPVGLHAAATILSNISDPKGYRVTADNPATGKSTWFGPERFADVIAAASQHPATDAAG